MRNLVYFVLLLSLPAYAQDYNRAAGLRGGIGYGLTFRQFMEPELSYEGLLSFRNNGLQLTALREHIRPANFDFSDDFYFTWGYGAHIGYNYTDNYFFMFQEYYHYYRKFSPLIGLDGYLGLEYCIPTVPIQIGLDFKPFFELSVFEFFRLVPWDFAFTIKYTF